MTGAGYFLFWKSTYNLMMELSEEDRMRLLLAMCAYAFDDVEPDFSDNVLLRVGWTQVAAGLDAERKRRDKKPSKKKAKAEAATEKEAEPKPVAAPAKRDERFQRSTAQTTTLEQHINAGDKRTLKQWRDAVPLITDGKVIWHHLIWEQMVAKTGLPEEELKMFIPKLYAHLDSDPEKGHTMEFNEFFYRVRDWLFEKADRHGMDEGSLRRWIPLGTLDERMARFAELVGHKNKELAEAGKASLTADEVREIITHYGAAGENGLMVCEEVSEPFDIDHEIRRRIACREDGGVSQTAQTDN